MKKGEGEIAVGCSSPPQSAPPSWPLRLRIAPEEPHSRWFPPLPPPLHPSTFPPRVLRCPRGSVPAGYPGDAGTPSRASRREAFLCRGSEASSRRRLNWLLMDLITGPGAGLSDLAASSLLRAVRMGFA